MNHPEDTLLHDFVDDELIREDRARVARHLDECMTCRDVVAGLRELREEARRVFGSQATEDVPVPPFLWEGIRTAIGSSQRDGGAATVLRPRVSRPRFGMFSAGMLLRAATVALLVGVSSVTTWLLVRPGSAPMGDGQPEAGPSVAAMNGETTNRQAAAQIVAAYQPVLMDLERLLEEGRGRLHPETIATLEENLRIIDAAIADVEAALASDPAYPGALRSLDGVLQAKLNLLTEAVELTRGA